MLTRLARDRGATDVKLLVLRHQVAGPAPTGPPAEAEPRRSSGPGGAVAAAAPRPLVSLPRHTGLPAALAPATPRPHPWSGTSSTYSTHSANTRRSTTPIARTGASPTPDPSHHCPNRSPNQSNSPSYTSTAVTTSADSSTNTKTPLDQDRRNSRQVRGRAVGRRGQRIRCPLFQRLARVSRGRVSISLPGSVIRIDVARSSGCRQVWSTIPEIGEALRWCSLPW
jgi:hypothetical protein